MNMTHTEAQTPSEVVRRPLEILVIEDNPDGRESLRILLELYGYHVAVAADGLEGVQKAHQFHPDVVLVDIGLPRLDGYQVARRLRAALGKRLRLMACTAYSDPAVRRHAFEAGFDDVQIKPMDLNHLTTWLDQVVPADE
jgi:CheY-like chemotaxis protein